MFPYRARIHVFIKLLIERRRSCFLSPIASRQLLTRSVSVFFLVPSSSLILLPLTALFQMFTHIDMSCDNAVDTNSLSAICYDTSVSRVERRPEKGLVLVRGQL